MPKMSVRKIGVGFEVIIVPSVGFDAVYSGTSSVMFWKNILSPCGGLRYKPSRFSGNVGKLLLDCVALHLRSEYCLR
jgi:hypothetical protein